MTSSRPDAPAVSRVVIGLLLLVTESACRSGLPGSQFPAEPVSTPTDPAAVAGCYVTYLRWNEDARARPGNLAVLQPPRLQLSTVPAYPGTSLPGHRVEAAAGDTIPELFEVRSWHVRDDGTVTLVWSTGFWGIDLQLRPAGEELTGWIRKWSDTDVRGLMAGDAVLRRIPCAPSGGPADGGDGGQP